MHTDSIAEMCLAEQTRAGSFTSGSAVYFEVTQDREIRRLSTVPL